MIREEELDKAVAILRSGGVVLHPTGSLYGLAVDAHNREAIARLQNLKKLPNGVRPFVLLIEPTWIDSLVDMDNLTAANQAYVRNLISQFWPGGLTLVLPASSEAPDPVSAHTPQGKTVALRADKHPIASALCQSFRGPLISTSANLHGDPAPLTLNEIPAALLESSFLIDGLPSPAGIPSTLLDCTNSIPKILRQGEIEVEVLAS